MLHQIAIEGCCHGQLDNIYNTIKSDELATGKKVDLVLICGDFQVNHRRMLRERERLTG